MEDETSAQSQHVASWFRALTQTPANATCWEWQNSTQMGRGSEPNMIKCEELRSLDRVSHAADCPVHELCTAEHRARAQKRGSCNLHGRIWADRDEAWGALILCTRRVCTLLQGGDDLPARRQRGT